MSEKARGALFNALGDIHGLTVVDAFAGTGAIAFEAISRGAKSAIAIDSDRAAQKTISANIESLGLEEQVTAIKSHAKSWLNRTNDTFDILVCDPPYNEIQERTIEKLVKVVKPGGIVVLSLPPEARIIFGKDFEQLSKKGYGDATLTFYRKTV